MGLKICDYLLLAFGLQSQLKSSYGPTRWPPYAPSLRASPAYNLRNCCREAILFLLLHLLLQYRPIIPQGLGTGKQDLSSCQGRVKVASAWPSEGVWGSNERHTRSLLPSSCQGGGLEVGVDGDFDT